MKVKGAEMGTRHHLHFHLLLHLWHRRGVAGVGGGPDACGHPASHEHWWQGCAAQLGRSGVAGAMAAGRSPRTGDARTHGPGRAGGSGAPSPRSPLRFPGGCGVLGAEDRGSPGPNTLTGRCGTRDRASAGGAPPAERAGYQADAEAAG